MDRWQQLKAIWEAVLKDIVLTGTGVAIIWKEIHTLQPNGYLIGAAVAFTTPSTWYHIKALLPSSGAGSSLPPSQGSGEQLSLKSSKSSQEEAQGE